MFVEVLTVGPYKLKEFVNVCVELLKVGPYTFVNFAKSPFKTPAWKAPTFPPSGGDTSSVAYALGLANGHAKTVLLAQHGT